MENTVRINLTEKGSVLFASIGCTYFEKLVTDYNFPIRVKVPHFRRTIRIICSVFLIQIFLVISKQS
jgi:uncharacterized membrane protein